MVFEQWTDDIVPIILFPLRNGDEEDSYGQHLGFVAMGVE